VDIIYSIYGAGELRYLIVLLVVNLVTGIGASIIRRDFRVVMLADWLTSRAVPLVIGYGSAGLLAWANPELFWIRPLAYATLVTTMLGFIFANLRDIGIPIPKSIGGKRSSGA